MSNQKNYPLDNVSEINFVSDIIKQAQDLEKDAFCFKEKKEEKHISYKEFAREIKILYSALEKNGFLNSHIACMGENSYKWVLTYFTALTANGVFIPVDKDLPEKDIVNVLCDSEADILFVSGKKEKVIRDNIESLKGLKKVVCFDIQGEEDDVFVSFANFVSVGEETDKLYETDGRDTKHLKMLVYTSGTTGKSKGVMLSEDNIVKCVYYGLKVSTVYTKCLSVLPYHHTYEAVCGLLVGLHHHVTICINDSFKSVPKNLKLYKPDYIYLVPAFVEVFYKKINKNIDETGKRKGFDMLVKLSNCMRKIGIDRRRQMFKSIHDVFGGNLIKLVCGGAPIRPEIGRFFDDVGILLCNGYGITECSPLVSVNRDKFNDPATVGVHLPCVEIKINEPNEEQIGEILVKGDTVMLGYYKNPEETGKVLSKDGWFNTGDYGKINEKGQLMITGRKKNIIVLSNGKNIYPEEIEEYIYSIPKIKEAIVYAPKVDGEEKHLAAQVVLNEGESATADELLKEILEVLKPLPSYKHIKEVVIRDKDFDKTTSNKIKRNSIEQ